MTTPWFQAEHLCYAYPNAPRVVHDVSLSAAPGTMTAIIGSNGSGKSTLMRMLAGLLKPQSGQVLLESIPFERWRPELRARKIGYVPQTTAAAFPFQVMDLVMSGRTPYSSRFRFETALDREHCLHALCLAGASHLAARPFTSLSGGERQIVILARALAQEAKLLLLDEPSSSLDLKHRAAMMRTLSGLRDRAGISVIMITHDLQLTHVCDRVLALKCGEVAASGPPDEVMREEILGDVFDDPSVRLHRMGDQHLVWMNLS